MTLNYDIPRLLAYASSRDGVERNLRQDGGNILLTGRGELPVLWYYVGVRVGPDGSTCPVLEVFNVGPTGAMPGLFLTQSLSIDSASQLADKIRSLLQFDKDLEFQSEYGYFAILVPCVASMADTFAATIECTVACHVSQVRPSSANQQGIPIVIDGFVTSRKALNGLRNDLLYSISMSTP